MSAIHLDESTVVVEMPRGRKTEPQNIFDTTNVPRLDARWLPSVIADFAFDRAELVGCDPAAIAFPALVIAGGLLPDAIKIQPKRHDRTWQESARLWHLSVAPPASKKTAAIKAAAGPAYRINARLAERNGIETAEYERLLATHKKQRAEEPPPIRPPWLQALVQDITIDALTDALIDNPRGVLMIQDELSEWFGSHDAFSQGKQSRDRPMWLQAFEGGTRSLNRVMRGRAIVPNWSVAIAGGIQPDVARRLFSSSSDGLTQRFIPTMLAPACDGEDRPDNEAAEKAYYAAAEHLYAIRDEVG